MSENETLYIPRLNQKIFFCSYSVFLHRRDSRSTVILEGPRRRQHTRCTTREVMCEVTYWQHTAHHSSPNPYTVLMCGPTMWRPLTYLHTGRLLRWSRGQSECRPAPLHNILNANGLFHIVLLPLSPGPVDTILVFSFVHACQNTKPVNYLSFFFKYKSIFLTQCCGPTKR